MNLLTPVLCLFLATVPPPETLFVQVAPAFSPPVSNIIARSAGRNRAVILLEGLDLHIVNRSLSGRAELRPWQEPNSILVRTLAKDGDIFAFSYSQTAPVTEIATWPALAQSVARLRQAGYSEIELLGFSAGGLIARQFVEDNLAAGVTKVIQVCAPNGGSILAKLKGGVTTGQKQFVESLSIQARSRVAVQRQGVRIPENVEFVSVVGNGLGSGDGVVSTRSQWGDDLQAQGVPVVVLKTEHWEALGDERSAQALEVLIRESQPRWDATRVAAMRKRLWR